MSSTTTMSRDEIVTSTSSLKAQHEYTERLKKEGFDFGLIVAHAFVRGIREIGYKHTGTALDELIDNSVQAGATRVDVVFGYGGKSDKKPTQIAIIDDGHGMEPDMIRASVLWGGTHREDDRTGFGRFGYGLPSACVSQGRRFSVYSRPEAGELHRVTIDLDELTRGELGKAGRIVVPVAERAELPDWVTEYLQNQGMGQLEHGTVVVLEKLDRLSWSTSGALNRNLTVHFGVTYRNFLRTTKLVVDGVEVDPIDPLFITPGMRYYDDGERAEPLAPMEIPVRDKDTGRDVGTINVRFSLLPPRFQRFPDGSMHKARFGIMKDHRGIIVCRAGRQIDVIDAKCPWFTFVNYDRNWGVEIDFPPVFDEEFHVTTSKQQVVLSDRMWDILKDAGVKAAIDHLKRRFKQLKSAEDSKKEKTEGERPSERAMAEAKKFRSRARVQSKEQEERSRRKFEEEVKRRAEQAGMPEDDVRRRMELEVSKRPYRVEFESLAGAPFFRVEQVGGQCVIFLNEAHRFYTDVYAGPGSSPRLRAGLEILLFVIGDAESDAEEDRRTFYQAERAYWSQQMELALDRLDRLDSVEDEASAIDAENEQAEIDALEEEQRASAAS